MMSLFDDQQIMRTYLKDVTNEAAKIAAKTAAYEVDRATAERIIKTGERSLEKNTHYVPSLSMEELKEI